MRITRFLSGISIIALAILITGCGASDTGGAANPTATPTLTPTGTSVPTATPGPWTIYTDPDYGFSVAMPTGLTLTGNQSTSAGKIITWGRGGNPDLNSIVEFTLQIGKTSVDCSNGTPIIVGTNISGRQTIQDPSTITPVAGGGAPGIVRVSANFNVQGLGIIMEIGVQPPASTFTQRFGPAWQHILASFVPGTGSFGNAQPCS